jgi:hypothetical protein
MSSISVRIGVTLCIGLMLLAAACTDARKGGTIFDSKTGKHPDNWIVDHRAAFLTDPGQCTQCHGSDLKGGISGVSCYSASFNGMSCHANGPSGHPAGWSSPNSHGASAKAAPDASLTHGFQTCEQCHGADFSGGIVNTSCFTCHGVSAPHAQAPWVASVTSTMTHTTTNPTNAAVCGLCHLSGRTPPAYVALPPGTPVGCFDNTLCHGQVGHAVGWANPDVHGAAAKSVPSVTAMQGFSTCQTCHGANFAGGIATTCLNTVGCHGAGVNSPHAAAPWIASVTSTLTHTTTNPTNAAVCGGCHEGGVIRPYAPPAGPVGCFDNTLCHGQVGHPVGWIAPDQHGAAAKSAPSVSAMQGFSTCQACHGTNFAGGTATTCLNTAGCHGVGVNSPHAHAPWVASVTSIMTHTTTSEANAAVCGGCHEGGVTRPYAPPAGPVGCFDSTLCHGPVANLGCVDCHASPQTGTHGTPRDAVVGEFGLAWGHKKSGRGAVTNADCIVCHLEGNFTTQARSALHGDGNIDLRDPDGAGETPITDINGNPFTFTKFSTSYAAGSRISTGHLSNTVDNVLTQKFCLACHDSNGATNSAARTPGGTAFMPWGGINLGANYTVLNGAAAVGGLVDVKAQFATTNSSYHPVLGPLNRDFPLSTRLLAPYDNQVAGRVAAGGVKTNSVVLNCFDCHNTPTTPLTNRTVAAHGNATTLRGTIYASGATSTLCTTCHTPYTTTSTHGAAGSGTAWTTTGTSHNVSRDCQACHGSQTGTARSVRPLGAQDYHGNNALVGGGLWPTVNSRPYAFIRGWTGGAYHRPFRASEFTTGNATCGAGTCPTGGQVGDGTTRTYTPGGTY